MTNTNGTNSQPATGLKTRTGVKSGGSGQTRGGLMKKVEPMQFNHNQTLATDRGIKVRTGVKAGGSGLTKGG